MPASSIVFDPELDERQLDREVGQIDDRLASVGEDVPVSFDQEELDSLSPPGGGGGGGVGGGAGTGAAAGLASKIPKPVAGVTAAAALPVALTGGVGLGMLNAMQGASARLQTSNQLLGQAWNNFWRVPGDWLDQFLVRPLSKTVLDASLNFQEDLRSGNILEGLSELRLGFEFDETSFAEQLGSVLGGSLGIPFGPLGVTLGRRKGRQAGQAINELEWDRFIDDVPWSELLSPFNWDDWTDPLKWSAFVNPLYWGAFATNLVWDTWVSPLNWNAFIPSLSRQEFLDILLDQRDGGGGDGLLGGAFNGDQEEDTPTPVTPEPSSGQETPQVLPDTIYPDRDMPTPVTSEPPSSQGTPQILPDTIYPDRDTSTARERNPGADENRGTSTDRGEVNTNDSVSKELEDVRRGVERLADNVADQTIEVDGETLGRVANDAKRELIGDLDPLI